MIKDEINEGFIFHLLLTLFLFNPVIIFLLFSSTLASFVIPLCGYISLNLLAKQKLAYIYAINLLALLSILFHSEVLFRFGFPEYIIENLYQIKNGYYFNKPYLDKRIDDKEYSIQYSTNANGYRIPMGIDPEKRVTKCDWLFIGDSFTQGAQVDFENLYTSQLYRRFPNKVIINAGISGFGIVEEYEYFKREGHILQPEKVFLQLCSFNDFMNVQKNQNKFSDYLIQYSDLARHLLYNIKYKPPGELPLGRWTEPFYQSDKDNSDYNIFFKNKSEKQIKGLDEFKKYLLLFKREVEKHGGELIVFLIPTKEQSYPRFFSEVQDAFNIRNEDLDMTYPNTFLSNLCKSIDLELIDLLPDYQKSEVDAFFEYDEHLNEFGHYLTAEIIGEILAQTDDSNTKLLSNNFLGERYPSYIKGDKSLLYQASRDGNMELFMKNMESGEEFRLTYNNINETHPIYNEARNLIAFTEGNAETFDTDVVLMDLETMDRKYITIPENVFGAIPSFSKNGNWITYPEWESNQKTNVLSSPNIVSRSIDSLDYKINLSNNDVENWRPIFVNNDSAVVYISKREGNFDIYLRNILSGEEINLTNTLFDEWDPSLSPDGKKIVYAANESGNWDLFEMELQNIVPHRLTETQGDEWDPSYSSDGKRIVYAGEFGFYNCIYEMRIKN